MKIQRHHIKTIAKAQSIISFFKRLFFVLFRLPRLENLYDRCPACGLKKWFIYDHDGDRFYYRCNDCDHEN